MIVIPAYVQTVLEQLNQQGFAAFVVGGCVRDSLLGRAPGDWDLTTAARPEQVHAALSGLQVLDTGLKHGTVTAVVEGHRLEITTFRTEGAYSDHRRPDTVAFASTIREDLSRRDFTVNAMAFSPNTGLIDPFGGQADLRKGILRAVGDPRKRFDEDALRILRGLRFAARLEFTVEARTAAAMTEQRHLLTELACERIQAELLPLLCAPGAVPVLRQFRDVFAVILPELEPMFDFDQQNKHHLYDVWEHTLHALPHVPPLPHLRLALLLHDCGKPARFSVDFRGDGHFYGHAYESARLAKAALSRLRCEKALAARVETLIALHDHDVQDTEKSLLRWLNRVGEDTLRDLLAVKIADNLGQHPKYLRVARFEQTLSHLDALLARRPCFDRSGLAVTGRDLQARGLEGKAIGDALDELVAAVIAGQVKNERESLLSWLK